MGETAEGTIGPPAPSGWASKSEAAQLSRIPVAVFDQVPPRRYKARAHADVLAIVGLLAQLTAEGARKAMPGSGTQAGDPPASELLLLPAQVPAWYEAAAQVLSQARNTVPGQRLSPEVQGPIGLSLDAGPLAANLAVAAVPILRRAMTAIGRTWRPAGGLAGSSELAGLWLAALGKELAGGSPQFRVHLVGLGSVRDHGSCCVMVADIPTAAVQWTRRWRRERTIAGAASASWWLFDSNRTLLAAGTVTC